MHSTATVSSFCASCLGPNSNGVPERRRRATKIKEGARYLDHVPFSICLASFVVSGDYGSHDIDQYDKF